MSTENSEPTGGSQTQNANAPVSGAPSWMKISAAAFIFIMFVLVFFKGSSSKPKIDTSNNSNDSSTVAKAIFIPRDTVYVISKGDTVRNIQIPDGWKVDCLTGGTAESPKKYAHRFQNGEWETWGDGSYHGPVDATFFDLGCADTTKKVEVVCRFSPK